MIITKNNIPPDFPKVDIVILTYNGLNDTSECLDSLRSLDYPSYRITVVDNNSQDGSRDILPARFPQVNYIYSDTNLRFAGGNNLALRKTLQENFQYALLLNNDTVVEPDFLSKMVELAEAKAEIGMVGAKMYYYHHPDIIWFAGGKADMRIARMRHLGIGKADQGQFDQIRPVDFLNGACVLIRCEILREIGLFDESFYLYGEDLDLCLRATKAGYQLYFQPAARIKHKVSRSTPPARKLIYRYQSWMKLIKKHTKIYWRPLQYTNLFLEFIPLTIAFILRKVKFTLNKNRSA